MDRNIILESVKDYCEIAECEADFDNRIIDHINTQLAVLFQNGVGPAAGYAIDTGEETWTEFTADTVLRSMVREYVKIGAKLEFDPPQSTAHLESLKERHKELEWRVREHLTIKSSS